MSGPPDVNVRVSLEKSFKTLSRWTIVLYIAVGLVSGFLYAQASAQRQEVRDAVVRIDAVLCEFHDDLARRLEQTQEYLKKHPEREPIPGITRADLRRSIQNQKATIESLQDLECHSNGLIE